MNRIISKLAGYISIVIILSLVYSSVAKAAPDVRIMRITSEENKMKAYLRNAPSYDGISYQIGTAAVDECSIKSIDEDEVAQRTYILIDNSISIPSADRKSVSELLESFVRQTNGEQIRLATISEDANPLSDQYTADKTALANMIESIVFSDQETWLSDVIYDVLDELDEEGYQGYTRLIVISDGVDNKPIGRTRDEYREKVESAGYPIYTIGVNTGKNTENLKNMYEVSRLTNAEYFTLNETSVDDMVSSLLEDEELSVLCADIPERARTGGNQSSQLTFSDGTQLVFDVAVPFSIVEEQVSEPENDDQQIPEEISQEQNQQISVPEEQEPEEMFETEQDEPFLTGKLIRIILGIIIAWALFVIAVLVINRRKHAGKKKAGGPSDQVISTGAYEKTDILGQNAGNKTVPLTPGESQGNKRQSLQLTAINDQSRTFRCAFSQEARIGRLPDNDIVISDDTAVHGHHCTLTCKERTYFITDLDTVKNHSSVNNVQLKPGMPQLIANNSRLTIGRYTYTVTITDV